MSLLPATATRRLTIEGVVDDEVLALLAARRLTVRDGPAGHSLEDVFLQLTGRALRD